MDMNLSRFRMPPGWWLVTGLILGVAYMGVLASISGCAQSVEPTTLQDQAQDVMGSSQRQPTTTIYVWANGNRPEPGGVQDFSVPAEVSDEATGEDETGEQRHRLSVADDEIDSHADYVLVHHGDIDLNFTVTNQTGGTSDTSQAAEQAAETEAKQDIRPEITSSFPISIAWAGGMNRQVAAAVGRGAMDNVSDEGNQELQGAWQEWLGSGDSSPMIEALQNVFGVTATPGPDGTLLVPRPTE